MGHHPAMAVTPRASDEEIDLRLERDALRAMRERARGYDEEAIGVLVELMRGEGVYSDGRSGKDGELLYYTVPPQVRRAAARDLVELGHGKAPMQDAPKGERGGVVVHIQRLTLAAPQESQLDPIGSFLRDQDVDLVLAGKRLDQEGA